MTSCFRTRDGDRDDADAGTSSFGGRGERPTGEQGPGEPMVTRAAVDVRVQAARDRLAEVPSDDVLVRLDASQAATVLAALDDAAALRREVTAWCPDCQATTTGLCEDHGASLEAADSYDRLRWQLEAQAPAVHPAERQAGWVAAS